MALSPYPSLATLPEVILNGGLLPARSVDAFAVRTVYASTVATPDCNLFTGLTSGGGVPTDSAGVLNAVLAQATVNKPVHLILDGGYAIGSALLIPATGHVTISGHGSSTGFYILPGSNCHGITNTAGTDLSSNQTWNPGLGATANVGKNVTLRDFRLHCNRGTYPNGNCDGGTDGTNGGSASPDARGSQTPSWLLCGLFFNALDNVEIDGVWIYDAPTFHANFYACTRVRIHHSRVEAATPSFSGNQDGWHLNGGCSDFLISLCDGATGDDYVGVNADEGNGQDCTDITISHCNIASCQSVLRVYGKANGACRGIRMNDVSARNIRFWAITLGDDGGVGASLSEATHSLSVSDCEFGFASSGNLGFDNSVLSIAGNAGSVELHRVRMHEPAMAYPFVLMTALTSTISRLVMSDCSIYRNEFGHAAATLLDGGHGTIGDLVVTGFHLAEESGHAYTDIANLINLHGTTVGGLTLSGKFKGVGTLVNITSASSVGPIDVTDLTHQSNAGSPTATSIVSAAGSAVPVSVGRYRGVNLAGMASGAVSLSGPGVLGSGFTYTDSVMANNTLYMGSDHSGALSIKVGGTHMGVNLT